MDDNHFDALSRWLGQLPTRRGLLAGLAGLAGTAVGVALPGDDPTAAAEEAKKRKKLGEQAKRRRATVCRPKCRGGAVCRQGKCRCRKRGQSCTNSQGCCGNLVCRGKRCQRPSVAPQPRRDCDVCAKGCRFTTVGAAVAAANPDATITVCAGTYAEATSIVLNKNVTIQGVGDAAAPNVTLAAPAGTRLFEVGAEVSVTMRRLRLRGVGTRSRYGVTNDGDLRMEACEVTSFGSGVGSFGTLTMTKCSIIDNTTVSQWGGLFVGGPAQLDQCEVKGNTGGDGGGIYVNAVGDLTLTDTTVTGNTALGPSGGGGIFAAGVVRLRGSSVVSGNTPDDCAGDPPVEGTCGS